MTTIKFNAGDHVFWLSSDGFQKGVIKSIYYKEERSEGGNVKRELIYRLSSRPNEVYVGDNVKESLIFKSYSDMVEYYKNNPVFAE